MVKKTVNMPPEDPIVKNFPIVPVGEHRFQITDVNTTDDIDVVSVKCEVVGGNGDGISLLHRITLNENDKFFWLTRVFLKCIQEPCRGNNVLIDTDSWVGRQFTAGVKHSSDGKYANIKEFIVPKENGEIQNPGGVKDPKDIKW